MRTVAVIGKNFGDEGKGLACASLSLSVDKSLIIKHNGGGQAGHTVETKGGKRFVHHQIGSGAEYGADTYFADTFYVDLFQLSNELKEFKETFGFVPKIYGEKSTRITVIDDVLRNMFIESSRGDNRHGSCGMGINECVHRHRAGLFLTLFDVKNLSVSELFNELLRFRREYGQKNIDLINEEFIKNNPGQQSEYFDMLRDEKVLLSYAECIKESIEYVSIVEASSKWLSSYEQVIFETGQGLLLDEDYEPYAPFLTPSKTGLHNIAEFLNMRNLPLNEVIYVTRSYVTRHGNGPLPLEVSASELSGVGKDATNIHNEWQGSIRYAKHESMEAFVGPALEDYSKAAASCDGIFDCLKDTCKSVLITHLDETSDVVYFRDCHRSFNELRDLLVEDFGFHKVYGSYDRYGFK